MSQKTETEEACNICGTKPRRHKELEDEGKLNHEYNTRDFRLRPLKRNEAPPDTPKRVTASKALQGDPVLRMALIRLGLVTPDQLTSIEDELMSAGIATAEEVASGNYCG